MRQKLNENRVAQLVLVGVLFAAAGLFLIKGMGGGGESSSPTTTTASDGAAAAPTAPTTSGTTADPAATAGTTAGTVPVTEAPPTVAAPPPPDQFVSAYDRGEAVVLLVVRRSGIEDQLVAASVRKLGALTGVRAFVVPASKVARYAAVTQGVSLDRVPALIVLRARHLSEGVPQASVSYGFRSPQSVVQAVRDTQYTGPAASYDPD